LLFLVFSFLGFLKTVHHRIFSSLDDLSPKERVTPHFRPALPTPIAFLRSFLCVPLKIPSTPPPDLLIDLFVHPFFASPPPPRRRRTCSFNSPHDAAARFVQVFLGDLALFTPNVRHSLQYSLADDASHLPPRSPDFSSSTIRAFPYLETTIYPDTVPEAPLLCCVSHSPMRTENCRGASRNIIQIEAFTKSATSGPLTDLTPSLPRNAMQEI